MVTEADASIVLAEQLRRLNAQHELGKSIAGKVRRNLKAFPSQFSDWHCQLDSDSDAVNWQFRESNQSARLTLVEVAGHRDPVGLMLEQFALQKASGESPGECLLAVNSAVLGLELPEPPLISMLILQFEIGSGRVQAARAAMRPPIIEPANGPQRTWEIPGLMIGFGPADYSTHEISIDPEERLVLNVGQPEQVLRMSVRRVKP